MKTLHWLMTLCEYLGGSRDESPGLRAERACKNVRSRSQSTPWWLGLWWAFLIGAILLFCGQPSKFIYIDF